MLYQLTLIIHGRVQGVFFRELACEEARRLKLVGKVENVPDGTVSVIIEGDKAKLEEFSTWCHKGPQLARVEKVEEEWKKIEKLSFDSFQIV